MGIKTHGQRSGDLYNGKRPRAYAAWVNMRQRCFNKKHRDFRLWGGRGITVCKEWATFEQFLNDMGDPQVGMSLDRIDNDKDYSKDNCRWATRTEQNLNKRSCVRYALNGKNQTLAEWARETGIGRTTMIQRLKRGVPLELALTVKGFLDMRQYGAIRKTSGAATSLIQLT